jgi:hypothetical protein
MQDSNLENKIIEKIQEQDIKPLPKTYFVAKNILLWILWVISVMVGALAFSVIEHMISNNDWDMYKYVSDNFFAFMLSTLPYFWIIIMIAFVITAYINFIHTKGAYKHRIQTIVASSLIFSLLLGFGFSSAQVGKKVDEVLTKSIPEYRQQKELKESEMWNNAERGVLSGEILEIKDKDFILKCCCGYIWNVTGYDAKDLYQKGYKQVRVFGEKLEGKNFKALEVRPVQKDKEIKKAIKERMKINKEIQRMKEK